MLLPVLLLFYLLYEFLRYVNQQRDDCRINGGFCSSESTGSFHDGIKVAVDSMG